MDDPVVSVIMAVRNEAVLIARGLGAVFDQDYPTDAMQIIVADGMSDDATVDIIRTMPQAHRVTLVTNSARTTATGLNLALRRARGDIVVRVDGHTIIAPDYVRRCVELLAITGAKAVGGPMRPVGTTRMGCAIAAATSTRFAAPTAFHVSGRGQFTDTVYLGAWRRETLEAAGDFNEALAANEDYELNYRIRRKGGQIYLSPALRSTYFARASLGDLARQYFRYGIGKAQMLRLYPASLRLRQLVAPAFLSALILGGAGAVASVELRLAWLAMISVYVLLSVCFGTRAARGNGSNWGSGSMVQAWRIAVIYPVLHLSWGAGFWTGMALDSERALGWLRIRRHSRSAGNWERSDSQSVR